MADQPQPPTVEYAVSHGGQSTGMAITALVLGILGIIACPPVGLIGLILGIIAVSRAGKAPQQYGGKGMAIAGIATGGASVAMACITVPLMISILLPSLSRARELSKRSVCAANLRGTITAIMIYANENDGAYPPDLQTLIDGGEIGPKQLICPTAETSNYVYVTGLNEDAAADTPVVYEPLSNHDGEGGTVTFADGHVSFLSKAEYESVLAEHLGKTSSEP